MANRQSAKGSTIISHIAKKVAEIATLSEGVEAPQPPGNQVQGAVAGIVDSAVCGWVWDSSRPYAALEVEVYSGNMKLGQGMADKFDLELARGQIGNGMHRFELQLDRLPPASPPFTLRVVVLGTDIELFPAVSLATLADAERLLSGSEYFGRITGIVDGRLCGWVVNRRNPHERPILTLRDGSAVVLNQPAGVMISAPVEAGVMANAYRFDLPLSSNLLDGSQHLLSVFAGGGNRELPGGPILFGPSDVNSFHRSIGALSGKLGELEAQIAPLRANADLAAFEKQVTIRILERIDMLLNIHRDALERELAVLRRQLARVIRQIPEMDCDVIEPIADPPRVEDETVTNPAGFSVVERSIPVATYDLSAPTEAVALHGNIKWSGSGSTCGVSVNGSGTIALDSSLSAPLAMILEGTSEAETFDLSSMSAAFDGRPLGGELVLFESRVLQLRAATIGGLPTMTPAQGISFQFPAERERLSQKLLLNKISIFPPNRLPLGHENPAPVACVVYLGVRPGETGWYAAEPTNRGGICWMGAESETPLRIGPGRIYRLFIPEVRPLVREVMSKLQISIGGARAELRINALKGDSSAFSVEGECSVAAAAEDCVLRMSVPRQFVRSPMELGMNKDGRPLTIAVRAIAVAAQN